MSFTISGQTITQTASTTDGDLSALATLINGISTVARSTAYTVGKVVRPPTANGFMYYCSVAGTTAASAPTYGTTEAGTTTDGTATFVACEQLFSYTTGSGSDLIRVVSMGSWNLINAGTMTLDGSVSELLMFGANCLEPAITNNAGATFTLGARTTLNGTTRSEKKIGGIYFARQFGQHWTGRAIDIYGNFNWYGNIGGNTCPIRTNGGSVTTVNQAYWTGRQYCATYGVQSLWFHQGGTVSINNLLIEGHASFTRTGSGVISSFNGIQTVQADSTNQNQNADTSTFDIYGFSPSGNYIDFGWYAGNSNNPVAGIRSFNSPVGTNLYCGSSDATVAERGWVEMWRQVQIAAATASNSAIQGTIAYIRDTNNGNRGAVSGVSGAFNATVPTARNTSYLATDGIALGSDRVYIQSTTSTGLTSQFNVLIGVVAAQVQSGRPGYDTGTSRIDRRSKVDAQGSLTNIDAFDIHLWAYGQQYTRIADYSMLGSGVATPKAAMLADSSVTMSQSAAAALTSISTLDNLYDAAKNWKCQSVRVNLEYPSISTQPVSANGTQINLGSINLIIDSAAAAAFALNTSTNTITIKSSVLTAGSKFLTLATSGTVTFANGASINAVYTSSAGQSTSITVNINQAGARLRLTDNTGTEKYNAVVSGTSITLYYPPGSTGSWSGAVELYGYGRQTFSLTVTGGGSFSASVVMIPDSSIVAPIATVSAYTALDTSQKIRDWLAFYNQTTTGIATPQSPVLTSSSLNIGSLTLSKGGTLGLTGSVLTTGSATLSGVSVVTTGTQTVANLPTLTYPQQFTDSTGTTNWLKVNLSAGQVAQDSYNNSYQTASYTTLLPASYALATSVVITARGYKKQVLSVPYSTSLLATQSATLIPDASVSDTTTDFLSTATALTSEQQMYDAYSQYQATQTGILDTYLPTKSQGALDFGSVSAVFDPSAAATLNKTSGSITYKVGTVNSGTYYSTGSVDASLATLSNSVLIRASNLDSELVYTANGLTLYPTSADRDAGTNAGTASFGGIIRFKYGSTVSGVTLSGAVYTRVNLGAISFSDLSLSKGANLLDLGTTGSLKQIQSSVNTAIALIAAG